MTTKKFVNQKELDNKTYITASSLCCVALLNSGWSKILTQYLKICLEKPGRFSVRSNNWIEIYIYFCKIGQLGTLYQKSNMIVFSLPESYHNINNNKDNN
jgi:hypothetical protein